jgi:disulfide oxidoreductase YuzD
MTNKYENVVEEFNKRGCLLLNTKDEYDEILKNAFKTNYRLNYTASCGHNHIVFYNVFKSRGTGIKCPSCVNKKNGNDTKEKMKNNEITKICNMEQEFNFIQIFKELVKNDFDIIKAFDGCLVDVILKPKNINENKWIGIQVKTTNNRHLTYSFHMNNNYKDCLLLFYCCQDESMWLVPENIILDQKKVSIGFNKSKYNIYKITKDTIIDKLYELYNITSKFEFDMLNIPINIYQQREQDFRKYRESKIDYIPFHYDEMEGTKYDFKIGNYKVQEKVAKLNKENRYLFHICKSNGVTNKKINHIQYDIGDNDFYWLNCENKITFFVIPEQILIDRGLIGNIKKSLCLKVTIKDALHPTNVWLQPYMFNYENIDKERLLSIIKLVS